MRSCESASICVEEPDCPSCSSPVRMSTTSAATKLAVCGCKWLRVRSASLVKVVATTVARNESPPTKSARNLQTAGSVVPAAPAPPVSSSAVWWPYVPSASTTGRPDGTGAGGEEAAPAARLWSSSVRDEENGSSPKLFLRVVNASATSWACGTRVAAAYRADWACRNHRHRARAFGVKVGSPRCSTLQ